MMRKRVRWVAVTPTREKAIRSINSNTEGYVQKDDRNGKSRRKSHR